MKIKVFIISLVLLSSCALPSYVPSYLDVGKSVHGSYIHIKSFGTVTMSGELITLDNRQIFVLNDSGLDSILITDVTSFRLYYAQPSHYGWTIPIYAGLGIVQGLHGVGAVPVNLLTTIIITFTGEHANSYTDKDMEIPELTKFARFPQGFPPGFNKSSLKSKE